MIEAIDMTSEPCLAAADLTFRARDGACLVAGASLTIGRGERLAVIGPNGAGKTTLLRLLAGLLPPSTGQVRLDGRPLADLSSGERARRIAVVLQNERVEPRMTVGDLVGLGRLPHEGRRGRDGDRAVVEAAMARLGVADLARRPLATLSGGERQRASLARALAQEPDVLFLDEPTNHLDPRARIDLLRLVRDLGIAVVAVLHDLALVEGFADRVAVLNGGRLVAIAAPPVALSPAVVVPVFALTSFRAVDPASGRSTLVFDAVGAPDGDPFSLSLSQRSSIR